ncbi:MAG: helix-turn-helix domain-containing protein [Lentisphaeraceae bacterium]|nr:helix-turn-helix domain-containing protein [Lentisphaeraceae bacterium]
MSEWLPLPKFGDVLLEVLEERNIKQSELAKAVNVPKGNISNIINNRRRLSLEMSFLIGKALGFSPNYFYNLQTLCEQRLLEREELLQEKLAAVTAIGI